MKMQKFLLSVISLIIVSPTFAHVQCPSVTEIQKLGVSNVSQVGDHKYAVTQFSNFNTENAWGFGMTGICAASGAEAIVKANEALSNLHLMKGPLHSKKLNAWECIYHVPKNYRTVALTTSDVTLVKAIMDVEG